MTIAFTHVRKELFESITAVIDDDLKVITSDHPNFSKVHTYLLRQDDAFNPADRVDDATIAAMFDPISSINAEFAKITDQVSIKNGLVLFEGAAVEPQLSELIVKLYQNDNEEGYVGFVKFLEKLNQNPNADSRSMLFNWLNVAGITINNDGDLVGYKGVERSIEHRYVSVHAGNGIVDGKEYFSSQLPNHEGALVEMARDEVTFDTNNSCARGLHIGTFDYAKSFGEVVLEVTVNPRDVVSVPSYEHSKLRACRYRVVKPISEQYGTGFVNTGYNEEPESTPAETAAVYSGFNGVVLKIEDGNIVTS